MVSVGQEVTHTFEEMVLSSKFHTNLKSLCYFVYGENLHNLIHDNEIGVKKCTTISRHI